MSLVALEATVAPGQRLDRRLEHHRRVRGPRRDVGVPGGVPILDAALVGHDLVAEQEAAAGRDRTRADGEGLFDRHPRRGSQRLARRREPQRPERVGLAVAHHELADLGVDVGEVALAAGLARAPRSPRRPPVSRSRRSSPAGRSAPRRSPSATGGGPARRRSPPSWARRRWPRSASRLRAAGRRRGSRRGRPPRAPEPAPPSLRVAVDSKTRSQPPRRLQTSRRVEANATSRMS